MGRSNEPLDDFIDFEAPRRSHAARDALGDLAGVFASDLGGRIREAPGTFAGVATFVMMFAFVGANALWHQPHSHANAFYSTRDHAAPALTQQEAAAIVRKGIIAAREQGLAEETPVPVAKVAPSRNLPDAPAIKPGSDPTVLGVQATLKQLGLYDGEVDGLNGSRTRQAVAAYQKILRLEPTGEIDETLLAQLRGMPAENGNVVATAVDAVPALPDGDIVASIVPTPRPETGPSIPPQKEIAVAPAPQRRPAADNAFDSAAIKQLQTGLRLFGNEGLDADGQLGPATRRAISEFQEILRLEVTGLPDERVFNELRRQGFIN
jgi:peptidoglycan hydrolase-like protein with peptidoglycan-binding domain